MKKLLKLISKSSPIVLLVLIISVFVILINSNNIDSSKLLIGLGTIFIGLFQCNYYYSSIALLEFKSFTKCNRRFDEMNELLNIIKTYEGKNEAEIYKQLKNYNANIKTPEQIILDYIDLCAEEYYLYKYSGIISQKVWGHWLNGMLYYFENSMIFYSVLKKELSREGSYYGFIEFMLEEVKKH